MDVIGVSKSLWQPSAIHISFHRSSYYSFKGFSWFYDVHFLILHHRWISLLFWRRKSYKPSADFQELTWGFQASGVWNNHRVPHGILVAQLNHVVRSNAAYVGLREHK